LFLKQELLKRKQEATAVTAAAGLAAGTTRNSTSTTSNEDSKTSASNDRSSVSTSTDSGKSMLPAPATRPLCIGEYYGPGLALLLESMNDLGSFISLRQPKLYKHMIDSGVQPFHYANPWFLTVFSYSISDFSVLLRFWDALILLTDVTDKFIFQFALAYLQVPEVVDDLLKGEFQGMVQNLVRMSAVSRLNIESILRNALSVDLQQTQPDEFEV